MGDVLNIRLWTGSNKPHGYFQAYRHYLEVYIAQSHGHWLGVSYSTEGVYDSGEVREIAYPCYGVGLTMYSWGLGHEVETYEGEWHSFVVGPVRLFWTR